MDIMSVYDPELQPGGAYEKAVDRPQYLPNIAWLINNVNVGDTWEGTNCFHQVTMKDLQNAVWDVIDDDQTREHFGPDHKCVAEQVAQLALEKGNNYKLDCNDPNEQIPVVLIDDGSDGAIKSQVIIAEIAMTEIEGLVSSAPTAAPAPKVAPTCPEGSKMKTVTFNGFTKAKYVDVLSDTLKVTAKGRDGTGYTPNGKARIFDSADPTGGDKDLGSPNQSCEGGGPGFGFGGKPGKRGENCNPLGKLLIIQESKKDSPDDHWKGGTFTFTSTGGTEMTYLNIGVIDADYTEITLDHSVKFDGVGDNGFQELENPNPNVFATSFDVTFPGSAGIAHLVSTYTS
jgi:hypothetical protein